mmetsp:Transcript_39248/g.123781  ORF Transcript_39248/g.123781 Transcript_39248/m.123781 type:complete len:217 (-) Transcript_39248:579-1229(-)
MVDPPARHLSVNPLQQARALDAALAVQVHDLPLAARAGQGRYSDRRASFHQDLNHLVKTGFKDLLSLLALHELVDDHLLLSLLLLQCTFKLLILGSQVSKVFHQPLALARNVEELLVLRVFRYLPPDSFQQVLVSPPKQGVGEFASCCLLRSLVKSVEIELPDERSKISMFEIPRQNFYGKRSWVCDDYALPGVRPRDVRVCCSILEHEGELDDER